MTVDEKKVSSDEQRKEGRLKIRTARYTVTVTAPVAWDKEEIWDDTHDLLRVAFQHIALDNTEDHFPDAIVTVDSD